MIGALLCWLAVDARAPCAVTFGPELAAEFMLDHDYSNLNHGSFGSAARVVLDAQRKYVEIQESKPDLWFRKRMYEEINMTRASLASLVHANIDDLVLIENASSGVNAVLRSLSLSPGDIIVYLSCAYAMVKNTAAWLAEQRELRIVEVRISFPIDATDDVVRSLTLALDGLGAEGRGRVRAVVFSHIVSNPGLVMPIEQLLRAARGALPKALLVVDGAHALGQVPLDMREMEDWGADVYLSNAHKWLFAPKGSCFLWAARASQLGQRVLEPTVIGALNAPGTSFVGRFSYTGTRDVTAMVSIRDAIAYRKERMGGEACIQKYVNGLASAAGDMLVELWGTRRLSPKSMESAMFNIEMPVGGNFELAQRVQVAMLDRHGVYMIALKEPHSGIVYTRLSSMVYLGLDDFVRAGRWVLKLAHELRYVPSADDLPRSESAVIADIHAGTYDAL